MKDYKFSNGIIEINGHKISYDISYNELKGWLNNNIGMPNSIWTKSETTYGNEENRLERRRR